jgi:hypothetical protein
MSMIKCDECKKEISDKAEKCPHCGAPVKKKTSTLTWIIAGIFGIIIINAISSNNSSTPSASSPASSPTSSSSPTDYTPPKPEWNMGNDIDSVSGKESKVAIMDSTNEVEMAFPYNGGSTGSIIIRKHPRHGKDVIFKVSKGQLLCDISDGCSVSVRFDDKPARQVHATEPADHSSDTLFLSGYDRLVNEIKASKKMIVEATFYQNGARTYEFEVEGLNWD